LSRLLSGHSNDLEPVATPGVVVHDSALDAVQREAVARALATPDLGLIQGLPGTGKSRVVAEIVIQAALQGLRVLLLAPGAAAIDRVLQLAGNHDAVCPMRCLGREESLQALPPSSQALTFSERGRFLAQSATTQAHTALNQEDQCCRRSRKDESIWPRLEDLAVQQQRLQVQGCALAEARQALSSLQISEEDPGVVAARARVNGLQTEIEAMAREVEQCRQVGAAGEPERDALRPLAEAKAQGRWWTGAWWQATFKGGVLSKWMALEEAHRQACEAAAALEEKLQRLEVQRAEAETGLQVEQTRQRLAEIARRSAEMDDQEAALRHEQTLLEAKWHTACQELAPATRRPGDMTQGAVTAAQDAWKQQRAQEEERLGFARDWAGYLQEAAPALAARLPEYANLVAATVAGVTSDEHFGDQVANPDGFDLLILEEADQVTESEFLKLAGRAQRWILVGEPAHDLAAGRPGESAYECPGSSARRLPAIPLRAGFFQRLWDQLHCDPRKLPYSWVQENGRLCCRLRPVNTEQRQWLETEHVADFAEIELRILVLPRLQPLLAEVVFPPSMTFPQAKEYIFKELQELPVQAASHSLRWVDGADQVVLHIAEPDPSGATGVMLAPGIRELVGRRNLEGPKTKELAAVPWQTCQVEFDRAAGWDRRRCEEWVQHHLGLRDLGRTVRLDVPRRMHPPLAAVLSDLLFDGHECCSYRIAGCLTTPSVGSTAAHVGSNGNSFAVEFIPVPPLTPDRPPRRTGEARLARLDNGRRAPVVTHRSIPAKGGAGLELDLAGARHVDRLPSELRAQLPNRGFVNYIEAQAIVRKLEALAADPAVRADTEAGRSVLAVVALYASQAELIRRLILQSRILRSAGLAIEVDVPGGFRHRESAVVLLSLTRSHSHRAVSFGEGPQALTLALTRARARLILFGDPGTLARRSQWEGPLDHLDEAAAGRERKVVAQLLRYLQGQGRHADGFHLCESSGT
jgi:hypothetical protein